MIKRFTLMSFLAFILLITAACSATNDDAQNAPLERYYDGLLAQDYNMAYSQLCKADQATISFDDFKLWQSLSKDTEELRAYKIKTSKELNVYKDPFGNRYPQAVEFTIEQTDFIHRTQAENTYEYPRTVVLEDGKWKISRGESPELYQHRIYYGYLILGNMYEEGQSVEKDAEKAIENYTNALSYNETDVNLYFKTALLNLNSQRPDVAESLCQKALSKQPEPEMGSELQNLLGVALMMQTRKEEAKSAFTAAIELNPQNSNAVNNLQNANKK